VVNNIIVPPELLEYLMADDTDDSRSFKTYLNYLRAVALHLNDSYGYGPNLIPGLAAAMQAQVSFTRLGPRNCDRRSVEKALRNAWATEVVILQSAAPRTKDVVACANLWATVQGYYAVYHAAQAFFGASGWCSSDSHAGTLRMLATIAKNRGYLPAPWNSWCEGATGSLNYGGVATVGSRTPSPLSAPTIGECPSRIAMLLRTTRERNIHAAKKQWLKSAKKANGTRYQIVPSAYITAIAAREPPTTLFDFLYRCRLRSNYRDADAFLFHGETRHDVLDFNDALTTFVQATLFVFEVGVARCVGSNPIRTAASNFSTALGQAASEGVAARVNHF
jgi:hypothetical protein